MSTSTGPRPRRPWRLAVAAALAVALSGAFAPSASAAPAVSAAAADDVVFTDDFQRPDGDLANGWVANRGGWRIVGGEAASAPGNSPLDKVATQDSLQLGSRWSVEADIRVVPDATPTGREWSGVVGDLLQTNAGLNYYALRVTTASRAAGSTGRWALIKMTNSSSPVALAQGNFTGPASLPGHAGLTTTLSRNGTSFRAQISDPQGVSLVDQSVTDQDPSRVGGRAGLYTVTDNLRAKDIEIRTSTPAAQPPGPLDCDNATGNYTFPQSGNEVIDTSDLGITWAGMFVLQDLLTRGDDQYVGFYDKDRNLVVAHRTLPDGQWTYQVLDTRIAWDSHNYISLGLDRQDTLHVSGNMHNVRLNYWRSAPGGDIATLQRQSSMVDPATENSVTYPEFVNRKDGSLVFSYRNGGSGSGVTYFNVYDEEAGSWGRLVDQPFFNGLGSATNPSGTWNSYFQGPTLGPDGLFHMVWVWRDTPDAATNSMLTYAKSEDLINWTAADGTPLRTPFKYGEGDVVDPIPDFAGLLNGNARIGFTADDEILISYHKYDGNGHSQLYAATPAGADWDIEQISDWTGRWSFGGGGTLVFEVQMLGSQVLSDGNVQVNFLCSGKPQSIVIDRDLEPLAQADTPPLPGGLSEVKGTYPGLQVNVARDRGDVSGPATDRGRYVLRWETLPENRDQPRTEWPRDGSPIQVVLLGNRPAPPPPAPEPQPAPTGRLSTTASSATTGVSFPVTLTFDQDVSGLEVEDLFIDGGTASDLTGSGRSYTFEVTADEAGEVEVSVPAGAVTNASGRANASVPVLRVEVRSPAPEAPLTLSVVPERGNDERAVLRLALAGDAAGDAVVTAESSNDRLLPQRSVQVDGSGTTRQLVVEPHADRVGTAIVTVSAEVDGETVTEVVEVHVGGRFANDLVGSRGVDVMFGRGGDDVLRGWGGADLLIAGGGRDVLGGGAGDDVLVARAGRSRLVGGGGADVFDAEPRRHVLVDLDRREGDTIRR